LRHHFSDRIAISIETFERIFEKVLKPEAKVVSFQLQLTLTQKELKAGTHDDSPIDYHNQSKNDANNDHKSYVCCHEVFPP
jgi:hypothetical protein